MAFKDKIEGNGLFVGPRILLVTFSPEARLRMEAAIRQIGLETIGVDGRAPEAIESLRVHQSSVVVVDSSAEDVSLTQTLKEVGRVRPECLVLAMYQDRGIVSVYRGGRPLGTVESLEAALLNNGGFLKAYKYARSLWRRC